MTIDRLSRRAFLSGSSATAIATAATSLFWTPEMRAQMPVPKSANPLDEKLDSFIAPYLAAMNAPGMTLGLTDADKTHRTAGYGYANIDQRTPVTPDHLFQIGSITKSFVALVLLQLHDEGKLEFQKPILDYLPDLPIFCGFGTITVHHLLTHSSGLPDNLAVFSSDPTVRLVQRFKPGEHFHYCNAGFDILGLLAAKLDGRIWRECVKARIFDPLDMTATAGVITTATRDRSAIGYEPFWDDQVYPRQGRLASAPNLVMDNTAGCIASTPGDMAHYTRMLLNRGKGPNGRIVSEAGFKLFSTPHIKAPEFSPTASYGYGIAVDTLDGHKILRHTGGMVAFASSIHVDLDGGVAAFASINAMQGYRPTSVTEYAVQLLRASRENTTLPVAPPIKDVREINNAADYAGAFTAPNGRTLTFQVESKSLALMFNGKAIPLQHTDRDSFISTISGSMSDDSFTFGRKKESQGEKTNSEDKKTKAPVIEVSFRDQWFTSSTYSGPRSFYAPAEWSAYIGRYHCDSPWGGDIQVYVLKDRLVAAGANLVPLGGALFRAGDEDWSPETAEFLHMFEGKARLLRFAGADFVRVEVE
ncbi:MAG TPA: serine hydrolase domain-containing protein [Terracidiphilus sp.]|jgi:CubicO group peptidase (beta-lactamase class C family)